jgi:hypothetical protein
MFEARKRVHDWLCNCLRKASAPRQLLIYRGVMNAENAGAFFCPASPKAPTVGAKPQGCGECRKRRSSFLPTSCIIPMDGVHAEK